MVLLKALPVRAPCVEFKAINTVGAIIIHILRCLSAYVGRGHVCPLDSFCLRSVLLARLSSLSCLTFCYAALVFVSSLCKLLCASEC